MFFDFRLGVKASVKAATFSLYSKALLHTLKQTPAEDVVLARIRLAQVVT